MNEYIKTIINGLTTAWQSKLNAAAKELRAYADKLVAPLSKRITTAQRTADNAQSAADNILTEHNISFAFDGERTGLPEFNYFDSMYCKISDLPADYLSVVSGVTTSKSGNTNNNLTEGVNCSEVGRAIIVTEAGKCSLVNSGTMRSFTAPETGIYVSWGTSQLLQATQLEIVYKGVRGVIGTGDTGIILTSSTSGSTKQFRITVDDSGTLSATEVT